MEIIYICAISLQVCGALILLIGSLKGTERKMIQAISNKASGMVLDGGWIDDIDISNELKVIYLNRSAFICLILGYLLGVFGEVGNFSRYVIAISIVLVTVVIVVALYALCYKLAINRQQIYKEKFKEMTGKRMI